MNEYIDVQLPRVYDGRTQAFDRTVAPVSCSVELNIEPLSSATLVVPYGTIIKPREYVEIFTSIGSVGIFRARNPRPSYGANISEIELESALVEIGDYLVKSKYEVMMNPADAITALMSHYTGTHWALDADTLSVFTGERQVALVCDYDNLLETLLKVMEQIPAYYITMDYSEIPWRLGFAKRDTTVSAEGRLGRNISSLTIEYDDSDMCTRAYYRVGENAPVYIDADIYYREKNGTVERMVAEGENESEVLLQVNDYLPKHREPKVSVEISADDLSSVTHESIDTFTIGKLMKLEIVEYDVNVSYTITKLSWDDVYGEPRRVTITIEQEPDARFEFVHSNE